jgi:Ca2+-binding EF-hand superfamily protein
MVQFFYDVIQQEVRLEDKKQALVEFADYNLMDGFQMIDTKNLGFVSAP